jgi:hypothetical protein
MLDIKLIRERPDSVRQRLRCCFFWMRRPEVMG